MRSILIAILFLAFTSHVMACTCVKEKMSFRKQVKTEFSKNDLVFTGNVIAKKILRESTEYESSADPVVYTFEVLNPFKGTSENTTIEVVSVRDGASCGFTFEIGKTYLVYAKATDYYSQHKNIETDFSTGICHRNNEINRAKSREIRILKRKSH